MDLCSITPIDKAEWMYECPTVMLLTHLALKHPDYCEIARNHTNYKILDNSIIELGHAFSIEKVYNTAKAVKANEIILEDAYPSGEKTVEAIKRSLKWLKDNNHLGEFKLQAVCHGETLEEFLRTLEFIDKCPDIDVIGIPKVLCTWVGERYRLWEYLKNTTKEIHFLGVWDNLHEIYSMPPEVWKKVRSCDTCLPSLYAIQHKHIWEKREGTIDLESSYPALTRERYDEVMAEMEKQVCEFQLYSPNRKIV